MNKFFRVLFRVKLSEAAREAQTKRILFVETNIMLPVKVVGIVVTSYFYRQILAGEYDLTALETAPAAYSRQLEFYTAGNLIFWALLLAGRLGELWPRVLRFAAFWLAMLDNLFLSGLIYFTGGLDSIFYWAYVGLMIRSAVNFPVFWQQAIFGLSTCLFYTLAALLSEEKWQFLGDELYWMRITILVLISTCCWGAYMLIEREQRRVQAQMELQLRGQKMAAAGRLAAEIAHQLKNPLGIINNAAYLLQRQAHNNGAVSQETVQVIRQEVTRADKVLTELMDYARLSEGRVEDVDVNAALEHALTQAQPDGLRPQVRVIKELAGGLPRLAAQRSQLEECFLNLIRNALDAMPAGGTLTLRSSYAGNERIEVEVTDTGGGIPADVLPKIFEAFFTTKDGGTGLGLAIVKNIIETYAGTISADSKPGEGTRFSVVLPVRTHQPR